MTYRSWGNLPIARQTGLPLAWTHGPMPLPEAGTVLPYGLGRSYGDSCLNDGGHLLLTRGLDRFLAFDPGTGLIRCEGGVSFDEVLSLVVPQGFFLPVTPGTRFVTVGGAIANDVHGKNHHVDGTFGHAVTRFALKRSDGSVVECSPTENAPLFHATIGGLGLTGLIMWAEFRLRRIANPWISEEVIKFGGLAEFFALSDESARDYVYTVSWIDCLASGRSLGRGLFMRGNHASPQAGRHLKYAPRTKRVPVDFPSWALNGLSVKAFNLAYYHKQLRHRVELTTHYEPFFYPLDAVLQWNRIYGRRGFFQYQCVVPFAAGTEAIRDILVTIAKAGRGSFLAVLKTFGEKPSLGLLSFPRPGVTLALDFPNAGAPTLALMERLDAITRAAGGAVYPAKDARMAGADFRRFFPRWEEFSAHIDPRFASSFWRRVMEQQPP